jgi:hypothetical protein
VRAAFLACSTKISPPSQIISTLAMALVSSIMAIFSIVREAFSLNGFVDLAIKCCSQIVWTLTIIAPTYRALAICARIKEQVR